MTNPYQSPETSRTEGPSIVRWHLVVMMMGFAGLTHFHRQSLPSVVNEVMSDCGLTEADMGLVYSSFLLGYVLFMVVGGWLADRCGGVLALSISAFGTALMVAATGYCSYGASVVLGFAILLAVRCLMGILTAPLFPATGRVASAWIPFETRAWANGLILGSTTIGVSSAPIIFGALSDQVGWRNACLVTGTATALLGIVWSLYARNRPEEHSGVNESERKLIGAPDLLTPASNSSTGLLKLLTDVRLMLLTLTYAAVGYYEYTLFYWMKYYFHDVLKYSEQESRYFTSIVTFSMVFAMPLGGILSDYLVRRFGYRIGRSAVPIFGMLSSAVLLFAATKAQGQLLVVATFFLAHAAIGLCEAPTWVAGLEIGRQNCGTSAAIVNTGGNLGGLIAPTVTAYLGPKYGWNIGFLVASLVCIMGVVLWMGIRLEKPTTHSSST